MKLRDERAARAWREAKTATEAWTRFATWLRKLPPNEDETSDAPVASDGTPSNHALWTREGMRGLVLFEKHDVMEGFLKPTKGSTDFASKIRVATATAPFAPTLHDVKLIEAHARILGGPIGYVGDLDPHSLHVYGALRSGKLDAPSLAGRKLSIDWLGLDDEWLSHAIKKDAESSLRTVRMSWSEREYWEVVKRLLPGIRQLVGDDSFALLERGISVELDAASTILQPMIKKRLTSWD